MGIDSIAGPTEVVIAADDSADPRWLAADLLAQAEHDELAVPILVMVGRSGAERVREASARAAGRRCLGARSPRRRWRTVVPSWWWTPPREAIDIVNRLAPEHAGLALADARAWSAQVTTAGALFLGHFTPESVGDYIAGPSHVLPTSGSARFASPLGVADFVKRTSIIEYDAAALEAQADDIERIAAVEGLDGHARAVRVRFAPR